MHVPASVHTTHPWRIHEFTKDFRIEDVWELRAPGRADDMTQAAEMMAADDPAHSPSRLVRMLFALRWKLGAFFGWDRESEGIGPRVHSLRERIPADLLATAGPHYSALPFAPLYVTGDEFAAEVANKTVHGVMHLARIPAGDGSYRGLMTVYVKPNGFFGRAYMLAIRPFRHLIYPRMMRDFERRWQARSQRAAPTSNA